MSRPLAAQNILGNAPSLQFKAIDTSKAKRTLGWVPTVGFEDGLARTVGWYREHEAWWRRLKGTSFADYYQRQYGKREAPGATGS